MTEEEARAFVARYHSGVLATIKRDGRPQLSNVSYAMDDDGMIKVSTGGARAKARNLRRDPRASLSVQGDDWHQYLVVEGTATVQDDADTLTTLRRVYEKIRGPHPNWDEFDAAMRAQGRVVLVITIDRIYPMERSA
jgi:PPOX class probable F420-dependent enzyme